MKSVYTLVPPDIIKVFDSIVSHPISMARLGRRFSLI